MHTTIRSILSLALALALALGLSSQRSLAQEPAPPNAPAQPNAPAPPSEPLSKHETKTIQLKEEAESIESALFQVDEAMGRIAEDIELGRIRMGMPPFDLETGPTLGETLARIESAFAAERFVLNVVVIDPELLKLPMAKTKLRAVGFRAVTNLIPTLMVDQPSLVRISSASETVAVNGNDGPKHLESRVMLVERIVRPKDTLTPIVRPAPENEVYKIDGTQRSIPGQVELIEKSQDNILAAIDTGLEVMGRSPEFQIKLHRPTGTVFVKGSKEELRMVREVVELVALPMGSAVFIKDPQP